jgi:predicted nucleotidyltransferase
MDKFGLRENDLKLIIYIISQYPSIDEAIIFGSRAKNNYRNGSDVNIALKGVEITYGLINKISYILNEETLLPYKFDILNYHEIKTIELIDHIDRVGISIYQKVADFE